MVRLGLGNNSRGFKMKIAAISDLHGHLPPPETTEIQEADILLIAGDICPGGRAKQQFFWLETKFKRWLSRIEKPVFGVAGNHDWPFDGNEYPSLKEEIRNLELPWTYLEDSGTEYEGFKIWGSPWQPPFFDWAFNLEESLLAEKFAKIPDDTDILITHGPPNGYGDIVRDGSHAGSRSLLHAIERVRPKLHVFGHIHPGRGSYFYDGMRLANVTVVNEQYRMVHKPFVWELQKD
jgi:Icc-related predicted phosphoesterase